MADISTILSWFQTGDFPSESQFRETFLSFMMKGDAVSISQVEGLTEILQQTLSEEQFSNYQFAMAALIDGLAKADGSNIDVEMWRTTLGITNIATVDGETDGNVYLKTQTDLKFESLHARLDDLFEILASDDVNLDELQELVNKIKENTQLIENLQQGVVEDMNVNINSNLSGYGDGLQNQKILNETMVSDIMTFLANLENKIDESEKGAAGGICPLNENGKVSEEYLPNLTATAVHNFLKTKKVADEVVTVGSMIAGSEVTMILSQVIDEDLDWSVYFNGVFVPKSLTSLEPNNSIKINLAPLNIEPVIGDYFVTKYYKL